MKSAGNGYDSVTDLDWQRKYYYFQEVEWQNMLADIDSIDLIDMDITDIGIWA